MTARRAKEVVVIRVVEATGSTDRQPVEFTCNGEYVHVCLCVCV